MNTATLSICCIVRDEQDYLAEWIVYHRLRGVERFYLYDDGSLDATRAVAETYADDLVWIPWGADRLEFASRHPCVFGRTPQITAFNHFLRYHARDSEWCAFVDVDEYLDHVECDDLRVPLSQLDASALFVQWMIFGGNGHAERPAGLQIESYTRRGAVGMPRRPRPWGLHGKLIARPLAISDWGPHGSHNAILHDGLPVDERGRPVLGASNPQPTAERWRLAHYYHRSRAEADAKVRRDDHNAAVKFQPTAQRLAAHDLNDIEDLGLARWGAAVRRALAGQPLEGVACT